MPVFSLVGTSLEAQSGEDDDVCNSVDGVGAGGRRCGTADDKFRSIDGSCNNLRNAHWGQANIALQRLLDPSYVDGTTIV